MHERRKAFAAGTRRSEREKRQGDLRGDMAP